MIYEIDIQNAKEDSGQIFLERLVSISGGLMRISKGALQLHLLGSSNKKGRKPASLDEALEIKLVGIKPNSTTLLLDCNEFSETLQPQLSFFEEEPLSPYTPISIVMDSFRLAFEEKEGYYIDKPLLNELKSFKKSLLSKEEVITIYNQGSQKGLELTSERLDRIKIIEEEIPKPSKQIVTGLIEELKYSKYRVKIQTEEGILISFLSEKISPEEISKFWGKEITVTGTLHYGLKGTRSFEIERLGEPEDVSIFKRLPTKQYVLIEGRKKMKNPLEKIKGKWPGDESIDELLDELGS